MFSTDVNPEDSTHHRGVTSTDNNNNNSRTVLALTTGLVTITDDLEHRIQGVVCPAKMSLLLEEGSCRLGWWEGGTAVMEGRRRRKEKEERKN